MHAEEKKLEDIFAESVKYKIPDYQRPYSWEEKQATQLFEDIYEAFSSNAKEYFIGSLILIKREDGDFDVVDGQQRLTTLTILFSSIMNRLEEIGQKEYVKKKIVHFNPMTKENGDCRLSVRQSDASLYRKAIIEWADISAYELSEPQEKMVGNRNLFAQKLSEMSLDEVIKFEQFVEKKVQVVWVHTENFPSAFRLFNVLNARGLPLSNSDLIKSSLLSKVQNEHERQEVSEHWESIEEKIGISNLDDFFGHLRTSILGNKQVKSLQEEFVSIIETSKQNASEIISDLLKSASVYRRIVDGGFSESESAIYFRSLQRVFYADWIPALLCYLRSSPKILSEVEFISHLEKITYQNWIRGLGRTKRSQVYYDIISSINKCESRDIQLSIFAKHANNEELSAFIEGDVYTRPYAKAVLLRIEDALQDDSVSKTYSGIISVEHVLPQTPKDEYWSQRFTQEECRGVVHKLGNLTLLSGRKNSAAQNYSFPKKKKVYLEKDRKVSFDMTKDICSIEDWDRTIIQERQTKYTKLLLEYFIM